MKTVVGLSRGLGRTIATPRAVYGWTARHGYAHPFHHLHSHWRISDFLNDVPTTLQEFEGPGFSTDDPYLHFYQDGRWGTWTGTETAIGVSTVQWVAS